MGIQVHSSYGLQIYYPLSHQDHRKVRTKFEARSNKIGGYDGPEPKADPEIPEHLDWESAVRNFQENVITKDIYHPGNWRKLLDYGYTSDMGVHIFDTLTMALELDVPFTITTIVAPTGFGYPEANTVTYEFPTNLAATETLNGMQAMSFTSSHSDLELPEGDLLLIKEPCLW